MAAPYDAVLDASRTLVRAGLVGDVELHLEAEAAELLLRDIEFQNHLLPPTRTNMPVRPGFATIGAIRVGERCLRIYERLI